MIVGTAGHIDHGKTSLVKALTGVDTDRLKEEKARGISIELGYAYMPVSASAATAPDKKADGASAAVADPILGFVDVPGHERFINTMLAGATGIDYVLLVVAADDGPMPQTREHLQILDLLGLSRGMVVLTKSDLVSAERLLEAEAEVRALLAGTAFAEADILPVSAHAGTGVEALRSELAAVAQAMPPRSTAGHFRLAVDRSFTLQGAGTVITGTAYAGTAAVGDKFIVSPSPSGSGIEVRVRSIHAQNRPAEQCRAGQRCALNLTGAHFAKSDVRRGDWVLPEAIHRPVLQLDTAIKLLDSEAKNLRHGAEVHFHLGAEHVTARVALLDATTLEPGGHGLARVTLARPIAALSGDRFVLRDAAATRTIGGGRVLDPFPPARRRREPARLELLREWEQGGARAALEFQLRESGAPVDLERYAVLVNLTAQEADALYAELKVKRIGLRGEWGLSAAAWDEAHRVVLEGLRAEHKRVPNEPGVSREKLARVLSTPGAAAKSGPQQPVPARNMRVWGNEVHNAVITELLASGAIVQTGLVLHLPTHRIQVSQQEQALWMRIRPLLAEKPYAPPRLGQMSVSLKTPERVLKGALVRMVQTGEVYAVSPDRFLLRAAVQELAATLRKHAAAPGVTAAGLRDVLGIGRNVVIEILEFFDRVGYTRRVGDLHRLRNENSKMFGES